jgi:hypothetical protein
MKLVTAIDRCAKSPDPRRVKRATNRVILLTRKAGQREPITATMRNRSLRIVANATRAGA